MKIIDAMKKLSKFQEKFSVGLFSSSDLAILFGEHGNTLNSTIKRLTKAEVLTKVSNGLYAGDRFKKMKKDALTSIAIKLRPFDVNYLSAESVLSSQSVISQQMFDRVTVMTTGRSGTFKTPYGVVEFTHTKRDPLSIIKSTFRSDYYGIRVAPVDIAFRDLKRIGRNVDMVDMEALNDAIES